MDIHKNRSFYKSLVALALPIALQNLLSFSVNLAGNIMVGSLGDVATSSVYAANQMQILLQVFTMGIEGSVLLLAAQYRGAGNESAIRKTVSLGLKGALIIAVLITVSCAAFPSFVISLFTSDAAVIKSGAEYLLTVCPSFIFFAITQSMVAAMRSVEHARSGLYVSLLSLAVTLFLSYALIFGRLGFPALGVRGAGIATLAARACEMLFISVYVLVADKRLGFKVRDILVTDKQLLSDLIKHGAPIIASQALWALNMLFATVIIGKIRGENALTAASIAGVVNGIAYIIPSGVSSALGILTGKAIGAGDTDALKTRSASVQALLLLLGAITFVGVRLIKYPVLSLYNISPAAADEAGRFIDVLSVTLIGTCYQLPCLFGLIKSGGDSSFVFKLDCIFILLIVIPSSLIAAMQGMPAWAVFACLKCDQILKCMITVIKVNRFDWIRDLTRKTRSVA